MKMFKRTEEYEAKLLTDELVRNVYRDASILIMRESWNSNKLKAYSCDAGTFVQFPRNLRESAGDTFVCDIIEVSSSNRKTFYRAVKNSIRKEGSLGILG